MKKIYTLLVATLITSISVAQSPAVGSLTSPSKKITNVKPFDKNSMRAVKSKNGAKTSSIGNAGWFNYGTAIETLTGATSVLNANYLFPDSMAYGDFGGTFSSIWIHHLAELVDFRSTVFSGDPTTSWVAASPTAPFKIDSMSVVYSYTRNHPDPTIVDTLIVTVYNNQTAANLSNSGFIGTTAANYATDTLTFKRVGYNQTGNFIAAPTATTNPQVAPAGQNKFKILLTVNDTSAAFFSEKAFALPTPFNNVGGKLVVGSVMFKPGYTYTLTQEIDATANAFFFASLEEQGAGTFPTYFDCNFSSAACDYNCSYIVPQDVRYNTAASWNYRFIPSFAYGASYGFEHHLISFHLTDDVTTGINNLSATNVFGLTQNVPNPFTKESVVNYNLEKNVNSATFTVTDIMGRVVSSEKVETTIGSHSIKLNSYAAGVYYYTLNVDGNTTTKKMIVE